MEFISNRLLDTKPRNTIEVISRSFSIIQSVAKQPWRGMTDVLIEPNVHHILWDEFVKSPQLIAAGEDATRAAMPQIKAFMQRGPGGSGDPEENDGVFEAAE